MTASVRRKRAAATTTAKNKKKPPRSSVFGKQHYNSGNGMMTDVWGPAQWHVMHTISFNFPVHPSPEQRKWYRDYVLGLQHVLPCGKCRENLTKNLRHLPLKMSHLRDRASFSRYIYDLHELVNTMLKKKSGLSYAQVRDRYEEFRARCAASATTTPTTSVPERGCTEPLVGAVKQRCMIRIVPRSTEGDALVVDEACHASVVGGQQQQEK